MYSSNVSNGQPLAIHFYYRKVRESASAAMAGFFASRRSNYHKQVLVQVDMFFHEEEDQLGFLFGGHESKTEQFKSDNNAKIQRTLIDLSNCLTARLYIEGEFACMSPICVTSITHTFVMVPK